MNEVKKCSISGIAFMMDTAAYNALRQYLDSLKESYGKEADGNEIIADIEARIAELILSTHDNSRVVELPLIENIIAQLGSADAISEESDTQAPNKNRPQNEPRIPRRLYRDMHNAKLGGVCAGVARYFDIDPVWVRLAMFVPLLITPFSGLSAVLLSLTAICGNLFGVFVLTYLILWFAIPAARSPRQRLEMQGEKITEQSIRANASSGPSSDADADARPVIASTVTVFGKLLLVLFKICAAFIIFGLSMGILALCAGLVAIVVTEGAMLSFGSFNELFALTGSEILLSILGIFTVLIPAVLLLYVLICLFINRKPSRTASITLFLLWIVTFFALCITAITSVNDIHNVSSVEYLGNHIESRMDQMEDAIEQQAEQIEAAVEQQAEQIARQAIEAAPSPDTTSYNLHKIDVVDIRKMGGTFRETSINIDK